MEISVIFGKHLKRWRTMNTPGRQDHSCDLRSREDRRQSRRSCRKQEKPIPTLHLIRKVSEKGWIDHPATREQKVRYGSQSLRSVSTLDKMDRGNHLNLIAEDEGSARRWSGPRRLQSIRIIWGTYCELHAEMVIKRRKMCVFN